MPYHVDLVLLSHPIKPDPGAAPIQQVGARAGLEAVAGAHPAPVLLLPVGAQGEVLAASPRFPRHPVQHPAVGPVVTRNLFPSINSYGLFSSVHLQSGEQPALAGRHGNLAYDAAGGGQPAQSEQSKAGAEVRVGGEGGEQLRHGRHLTGRAAVVQSAAPQLALPDYRPAVRCSLYNRRRSPY